MSGSGNSGGNSFGGDGTTSFDCQKVSIKTSIISPDPTILATLKPTDVLSIQLRSATGPLIAITNKGDILGSIFTSNPSLLIDCINQGFVYEAEILNISGANCEILIRTK